ncbi:MAG: TraB/GumN family protein [Bacteroidota bacterium]|nr:TraB/GumN family protein [Bacteroidota bacterium]MDP4245544.1 TraB/GumN family protein [Bacteroidota bacterium]MDP4256120.1 TraB/GumN family protein [Bacteroidota bacterium]MDP4259736.1 TraB/GumN family protein [Bacteroidota bacterium]
MEKKQPSIKPPYIMSAGLFSAGILAAVILNAGLLSWSAGGQSGRGARVGAATPHTLLWRISGKGLAKPSYLFGTMHVLCAEDASLSDSLKAVISSCDQIWFEIDLSDMSGMLGAMKAMRMNDSKKLSDLLDSSDYRKVKDYFAHHSSMLPFGMLERFKPMLISSIIEENNMACKTTDGMELMIMKEAQSLHKPIKGLETAEFQAGLFDSIPYEKQAKDLVNSIDSMEQYKQMTLDLAAVYKAQDLDKIDSLSRKDDPGMDEYMDLLLYGRNRKWAKELDMMLNKGSLLIAVGAAHLPGEQGVINLLRKRGYAVTPVPNGP